MRISPSVSWALAIASVTVSAVLWRALLADRQLVAELRTQLGEARAALDTRPPAQPGAAIPQTFAIAPATTDALAAPPDKAAQKAASTARLVESVQRQTALLDDAGYRKARVAKARSDLQLRYPNLARDLGFSENEIDALFTFLVESDLRQEVELNNRIAGGATSDDAMMAEFRRLQKEQKQQQKDGLVAQLGPGRYTEFQEYQQTTASRERSGNLTSMLAQAGNPPTIAQSNSLTALMIAEQRRRESESQTGPSGQSASAERAIASDRRVLEAAAAFLDAQQIDLLKVRFEQEAARQRSSDVVQQRLREVEQGAHDGQSP
jgi:hypothetical protein